MKYDLVKNDGVFTLKNQNTTIGFDRFNELGEVEYIFVNPLFRKKIGKRIVFQPPISPLGEKLISSIKDFN